MAQVLETALAASPPVVAGSQIPICSWTQVKCLRYVLLDTSCIHRTQQTTIAIRLEISHFILPGQIVRISSQFMKSERKQA
jgi:hypothetical protein